MSWHDQVGCLIAVGRALEEVESKIAWLVGADDEREARYRLGASLRKARKLVRELEDLRCAVDRHSRDLAMHRVDPPRPPTPPPLRRVS